MFVTLATIACVSVAIVPAVELYARLRDDRRRPTGLFDDVPPSTAVDPSDD